MLGLIEVLCNTTINLEEADNAMMKVGAMRPEEHSYANYDADH